MRDLFIAAILSCSMSASGLHANQTDPHAGVKAEAHGAGEAHHAEGHHGEGHSVRGIFEVLPGVVLLGSGPLKVEPTISVALGAHIPLFGAFSLAATGGYEFGSLPSFKYLLHGPEVDFTLFYSFIPKFAVGLGLKGGLDFKNKYYVGGFIAVDAKLAWEVAHNFELALVMGPRIALHVDKTYVGGEFFAVAAIPFP